MSRTLLLTAAAALASFAVAGQALAQSQAATIRIEPRPYYGASITLEQGVRVWRPLPTTKYVIINPDNKTPLNLNLADVREHVTSENHYYDHSSAGQGGDIVGGGGFGGVPRFGANRFPHRMNDRRHHRNGGLLLPPRHAAVPHGRGRR